MFGQLISHFVGRRWLAPSRGLYAAIVAEARRPDYYTALGVADTVDGRFDMICLMTALTIARLQAEPPPDSAQAAAFAQKLFDTLFNDMDGSLREMGVGDLGVGKHIKTMAKAYYGRAAAYEHGLSAPPGELEAALRRNLYRLTEPHEAQVAAMAAHIRAERHRLAGVPLSALAAGQPGFQPPPSPGVP